jgi:hypothetical protein
MSPDPTSSVSARLDVAPRRAAEGAITPDRERLRSVCRLALRLAREQMMPGTSADADADRQQPAPAPAGGQADA